MGKACDLGGMPEVLGLGLDAGAEAKAGFSFVGGPPRSLGPTRPHRPDRPAGDGPVSDGRDGLAGVPEAPCVMAGWGSCAAKDLQE